MKLPIGQSNFRNIIEGGFEFVDKSLFIQDILDDTEIILITRPRRFGKTLNLSMLQHFFAKEVLGQSTQGLFDNLRTPIHSGYTHGYYDEMIQFIRNFLGRALKDNSYLFKAILTGILRITKESLFSDLNNVEIYSLLRKGYSSYFGFTEEEVKGLLSRSQMSDQLESIKDWYNGYQMGDTIIYNPWSIISCLKQEGTLKPYWVNTSDNTLIRDLIIRSSTYFKSQFESLLLDKPLEVVIDERMAFQYLKSNESAIWSLFLMAGYLKPVSQRETDQGLFCNLAIPNREVRNLYRQIIERWLSDGRTINWYNQFLQELLNGNVPYLQKYLNAILIQTASVRDIAKN